VSRAIAVGWGGRRWIHYSDQLAGLSRLAAAMPSGDSSGSYFVDTNVINIQHIHVEAL